MSTNPPESSTGVALYTPTPSLLGTPPEIRAIIYQYVFADDKDLIVHLDCYHRWGRSSSGIGAVLACRTIYLEAIGLLYSSHRFQVDCPRAYLRIGHDIPCPYDTSSSGWENAQYTIKTKATGFLPPRIHITLYYIPYTASWEYHWTKDLELWRAVIDLQARIKTSNTTVQVAFSP